ncbi:hypothetical protein HELRODRAFT_66923 [Helobdella robusta]|uniref:Protein kinase domain-containing protein n=1 Tax=Helobdella robusta TaxID=6412 RepID=T1FYT2_HELRO|nr:hypothetical protein HELRODRAFT_66923 [Helobdella robusta]ESN98738.1 hypothetical protein HELRODRAFT_66923 [Helobdella robusta]
MIIFNLIELAILEYNGKNLFVAAKTFNNQTTTMEEFNTEIEMMKSLRHPNIVHMIGVCRMNDCLYMVTEIMAGGSLQKFLREDKGTAIQIKDLLNIALQICGAMTYLEQKCIVHRDLAARNVLVSKNHNVFKLSDFGMAIILNKNFFKTNVCSIPVRWAAPEILSSGKYHLKSDVWSFGIFLVELFTYGNEPYDDWNLQEVREGVLNGSKHRQPRSCPDQIYVIMSSCWCLKHTNRPSFDELNNSLETFKKSFGIYLTTSVLL